MTKLAKILSLGVAIFLTFSTLNAQQELRVGLQDAEPGVIRNGGQLTGRDIDIWNAIAKHSGLHVTYVVMADGGMLQAALDEGKVDVIGWGVSRTPATEAKYLLTDQILPAAEALVVPASNAVQFRSADDIKGLKFATLKGSVYANYLKQIGVKEMTEFTTVPEVLAAVDSGAANAAMFSSLIAGYMNGQGKLGSLQVVKMYQAALSRPVMAAFRKTDSERYRVANTSLQKLTADGTIRQIAARYGL